MLEVPLSDTYGVKRKWQYAHPLFQTSFDLFMKIVEDQIKRDSFVFEEDEEAFKGLVETVNELAAVLHPYSVLPTVWEYARSIVCDELKSVVLSVESHLSRLAQELPYTPWYMGTTRVVLRLESDATGNPIAAVYIPICVFYNNGDGWLRRELPVTTLLEQGTLTVTNDAANWPPPEWHTYSVNPEFPELPNSEQLDESNSLLAEIEFPILHAGPYKWTGEVRRALRGVVIHD